MHFKLAKCFAIGALSLLAACGPQLGSNSNTTSQAELASNSQAAKATATPSAPAKAAHAGTPSVLRCDFKQGDRLGFTMSTRATFQGDLGAMGPNLPSKHDAFDHKAQHDIELRVLEAGGSGPALVQFSQRAEGGEWAHALVKIGRNCDFEDVGMARDVDATQRHEILSRLAAFEFIGSPSDQKTWTVEQPVPFGKARFAYRAEAMPDGRTMINRRVAKVLEGDHVDTVREAGQLRAWVEPGAPWLSRLEIDRQTLITHAEVPTVAREQVTLAKRAPRSEDHPQLNASAMRWEGKALKQHRGHNRTYNPAEAPPGLASASLQLLSKTILDQLQTDSAQDLLNARRLIVHAFRARRDLGQPMVEALMSGALSERRAGSLILALTDAGTPEAERALAAIVEDPRTPFQMRHHTAFIMHRQVSPTRLTVDTLTRAADDPNMPERTRHTALAALGGLVGLGRLPAALEDEVLDQLLERLENEKTKALQLTLLSALGNTRHAATLDAIERLTGDDHDSTVRVHAMVVLDRMGAAPSPSRILKTMDAMHDIRHLDRLKRLAQRGDLMVTDADIEQARAHLNVKAIPSTRMAATHILGRRATIDPTIRKTLAEWYVIENDAMIKRAIGEHVSATELRRARKTVRVAPDAPKPADSVAKAHKHDHDHH